MDAGEEEIIAVLDAEHKRLRKALKKQLQNGKTPPRTTSGGLERALERHERVAEAIARLHQKRLASTSEK